MWQERLAFTAVHYEYEKAMKIAYIVGGLPFGGVETWLLTLHKELTSRGHEPVVINISGTGIFEEEYLKAGITPHHVGNSTKVLKTTRFDTTRKLRALLKEIDPDIIHTAHFSADYHGRLASIGLGKPVVTHLRNIKIEPHFTRRLANRLLSFATDMYIGVAQAVVDQAIAPFNMARRPSRALYNAISLERLDAFPEVDLSGVLHGDGPVLLSVCRLVKQKNMDVLIKAFAEVKASIPDAELLILGEGPRRQSLEELAESLGVAESCHLAGFRPDVAGILKAVGKRQSLFVMPSDYEGFGIAPLEAFHYGIPALISPFVPLQEVARDAAVVCGLEPQEVAQHAMSILSDRSRWEAMSSEAKAVAEELSIQNHARRLLEIYEEVLEGR